MRFLRIVSLVVLSLAPLSTFAATIVVLKGSDSSFQRRYFSGFSSVATEKISAFRYDVGNDAGILAQVRKLTPDLLLVLGGIPLRSLADQFPSTPIIAAAPSHTQDPTKANVIRLGTEHSFVSQIALLKALFPQRTTVGTLYNPKLSQDAFQDLVEEAGKSGIRVAALKIDNPLDATTLISAFAGKIDSFIWMGDATTSTPSVVKTVFEFAEKNNVPVFAPDTDLLEKGAVVAASTDPIRLGEQAWRIAKTIVEQKKIPTDAQITKGTSEVATVSLKALSRFGVGADGLFSFFQKVLKDHYTVQVVE